MTDAPPTDPTTAALASLDFFIAAFNGRDLAGVRAACNYPHVLMSGDRIIISATGDDLSLDFDDLERREGWHHSTFDDIEIMDAGPAIVDVRFNYTRYHADGTPYFTGRASYVFTKQDGHWGRQAQLLFN